MAQLLRFRGYRNVPASQSISDLIAQLLRFRGYRNVPASQSISDLIAQLTRPESGS